MVAHPQRGSSQPSASKASEQRSEIADSLLTSAGNRFATPKATAHCNVARDHDNAETPSSVGLAGTRYALLEVMANTETHGAASSRSAHANPPATAITDPEVIAELHAHDSSSVAPSRADQPRVLLRSPTMWAVLYVPTLLALSVLGYMLLHLHRGDPGRIPGAGDRGSPNAQPGDK